MAVALVDTNVLFAGGSARDEYHDRGRAIIRGVDHGELPECRITNYVIAEILNLTRERLGTEISIQILDRLIEGSHFNIDHSPKADFNAAQAIFRRYTELSFVDATIAAYMEREGIEYLYSFDDDFEVVDWITRLETPDNPYR